MGAMPDDAAPSPSAPEPLPEPPRLPERAAIYIDTDGTVRFGALFRGLVPVARALGGGEPAREEPGP
jgi:hypothetical protein